MPSPLTELTMLTLLWHRSIVAFSVLAAMPAANFAEVVMVPSVVRSWT